MKHVHVWHHYFSSILDCQTIVDMVTHKCKIDNCLLSFRCVVLLVATKITVLWHVSIAVLK